MTLLPAEAMSWRSCADGAEGKKVNILANKKTHSANFTVCSLCVLVLYDKILCKTTELEGVALPKFFGMEVMSIVYFSFQDLMSFGIFIVALLTFIFQNRR